MKTLVIYAHLLAACVSIGTLLLQDLALWRSRYRVLTQDEVVTLRNTATIVFIALLVLWATGAGLVTMGYLEDPQAYFSNQKIWAKFSVVIILSFNGVFLHFYCFPKLWVTKRSCNCHRLIKSGLVALALYPQCPGCSHATWVLRAPGITVSITQALCCCTRAWCFLRLLWPTKSCVCRVPYCSPI